MNAQLAATHSDGSHIVLESIGSLADALAKAQGEFLPIHRARLVTVPMKAGGKYTFAYAPLEVILRAVSPALAKYGLALTQAVIEDCVETRLLYGSESLSNRVKIIGGDSGGAQAYGSALTYARRYGVTLLLCVCADDDDDGAAASDVDAGAKSEPPRPVHADVWTALTDAANLGEDALRLAWKGVSEATRNDIMANDTRRWETLKSVAVANTKRLTKPHDNLSGVAA